VGLEQHLFGAETRKSDFGLIVAFLEEAKHGPAAENQGIEQLGAVQLVQNLNFKNFMPIQDIHVF
jgi:hypothetical protein